MVADTERFLTDLKFWYKVVDDCISDRIRVESDMKLGQTLNELSNDIQQTIIRIDEIMEEMR